MENVQHMRHINFTSLFLYCPSYGSSLQHGDEQLTQEGVCQCVSLLLIL